MNLLIGFTGTIDWRAHLGGLAVGALLAFVYDYAGDLRDRTTGMVLTVGASAVVLPSWACCCPGLRPDTSTSTEPRFSRSTKRAGSAPGFCVRYTHAIHTSQNMTACRRASGPASGG